jgi:hypothetical protein
MLLAMFFVCCAVKCFNIKIAFLFPDFQMENVRRIDQSRWSHTEFIGGDNGSGAASSMAFRHQ